MRRINKPYTYPVCPVDGCGRILVNGGRCPEHGGTLPAGAEAPPPAPAKRKRK